MEQADRTRLAQQLRQLGDVRGDPPCLVVGNGYLRMGLDATFQKLSPAAYGSLGFSSSGAHAPAAE
jgi:hypothetical protein